MEAKRPRHFNFNENVCKSLTFNPFRMKGKMQFS